jgi:hypothetical protein
VPADHLAVCKRDGTPTVGNAAGNSKNFLDLAGQPSVAPRYDYGYAFCISMQNLDKFELTVVLDP